MKRDQLWDLKPGGYVSKTVRRAKRDFIWLDLGKTHPWKNGDGRIFGAESICQQVGNSATEVPLIAGCKCKQSARELKSEWKRKIVLCRVSQVLLKM